MDLHWGATLFFFSRFILNVILTPLLPNVHITEDVTESVKSGSLTLSVIPEIPVISRIAKRSTVAVRIQFQHKLWTDLFFSVECLASGEPLKICRILCAKARVNLFQIGDHTATPSATQVIGTYKL